MRRDKPCHDGLESVHNGLRNDFVCNTAKAGGSELTNFFGTFNFGNKGNQSFVDLLK